MEIFVGTSGWMYDWNEGESLEWFCRHSGLNAVELNMSFYRFPFPNQIRGWAARGGGLRWAVKVNRLITHRFKFGGRALELWRRFERLFGPMEGLIDFYFFQLPPALTPKSASKLGEFIRGTGLGRRFALEVRNLGWFEPRWVEWARGLGITWVSVDSPDFPRDIHNTSGLVYLRMHGRDAWYSHNYSDRELREVAEKIEAAEPGAVYIYFNNNHDMLENARRMLGLLRGQKAS
jgi:uncharacterized protein YecE (DUF72 family)